MRITILWIFLLFVGNLSAQDLDEEVSPQAKAAQAMRTKRFREAENLYRDMLQKNPESMTCKHLLGHSLMMQGRYPESDSLLQVAYLQDSSNPGTFWYFGLLAERQDEFQKAYVFFREYINKSKRFLEFNYSAWLHAGSAYRRKMHTNGINNIEWADMIYCYENYLQSQPADPIVPQLRDFLDEVRLKQPRGKELLIWEEAAQ